MKKIAIIITSLYILAFAGCQIQKSPAESTAENQVSLETQVISYEEVPYVAYDMDTFLNDWVQAQESAEGVKKFLTANKTDPTDPASITIPVLQTDDYRLVLITVNEYRFFYYYYPKDVVRKPGSIDMNIVITISISKLDTSFEGVVDQFDLVPMDGKAYCAKRNEWFINDNGREIGIRFPESIVLKASFMLDQYFLFEKYTAPANNNDHVTE